MTAFDCKKCPMHSDYATGGCPAWWELLEKDEPAGRERISRACAFTLMPRFLLEVMRFAQRAAASTIQVREDILGRLEELDGALAISRGVIHISGYAGERAKSIGTLPGTYAAEAAARCLQQESSSLREHEPGTSRADHWPAHKYPVGATPELRDRILASGRDPRDSDLVAREPLGERKRDHGLEGKGG